MSVKIMMNEITKESILIGNYFLPRPGFWESLPTLLLAE